MMNPTNPQKNRKQALVVAIKTTGRRMKSATPIENSVKVTATKRNDQGNHDAEDESRDAEEDEEEQWNACEDQVQSHQSGQLGVSIDEGLCLVDQSLSLIRCGNAIKQAAACLGSLIAKVLSGVTRASCVALDLLVDFGRAGNVSRRPVL